MKKFLSLVLALAMAVSLVTVGAGARDFTDDGSITYDEAVAVLSELGIVDGYTDGDFKPANTLTRQAAAKIICNLILGPTTASALSADATPVMILSAKAEKEDRILGFDSGADDYLPKPFAPDELLSRVRAMLRRRGDYQPAVLRFGSLFLDSGARVLRCGA